MHKVPDDILLAHHLSELLQEHGGLKEIESRKLSREMSTYPIELVTCRLTNGEQLTLFIKYLAGGGANSFGHRGGLLYEADFYANVLRKIPVSQITYFGLCQIGDDFMMVLKYLGDCLRFAKSKDRQALDKAAAWAGGFHSFEHISKPEYITDYNADYYNIWLNKFKKIAEPLSYEYPVLQEIIFYFSENLWMLTEGPKTFIHGEYYSRNVLFKDGIIYPVDWESAAWAPGETDLASLVEQWDDKSIENAKAAYTKARWPDGNYSKEDFEKRLLLCKLYFFFRWCPFRLDETSWIQKEKVYNYLMQIYHESVSAFSKKDLIPT